MTRAEIIAVPCPLCSASSGEYCIRKKRKPHAARIDAAWWRRRAGDGHEPTPQRRDDLFEDWP